MQGAGAALVARLHASECIRRGRHRGSRWLLGFAGQGLRVAFDSLLVYLPAAVMGRVPPTPQVIPIPADSYYWFLLFAAAGSGCRAWHCRARAWKRSDGCHRYPIPDHDHRRQHQGGQNPRYCWEVLPHDPYNSYTLR